MIEPRTKLRVLAALAVSGFVAVGLALTYLLFVLGTGKSSAEETSQHRAARCLKAPEGELVLNGKEAAPLADSTALTDAGKIKPIFVNGSTVGLEIAQIRAGSLYDRAGLCDNDIVTSVGGIHLDSPEATLDAYEQLRDQKIIAVELLRRGAAASYRVRVE